MRLTIAAFLMLLTASCKKESNPAASGRPDFAYNVKASHFLQMVNDIRKAGCKCGTDDMPPVAPLEWNDLLAKAAYDHSEDMSVNKYFSHTGKDGSNVGTRLTRAGYAWSTWGENIASGQITEEQVFNSWIKSPGHCRNIMNAKYKEMGLGRSANYWTQTFGVSR